jgi:formamidopyrimidine-DNA glycosylase
MPEIPEIAARAGEMNAELRGKTIQNVDVLQPKCLNIPADEFAAALTGAEIKGTTFHGKWLITDTTRGWFLLNLGMGGEILLVTRQTLPEKRRLIFDFSDGTALSINFWWFGYAHYMAADRLPEHKMTAGLGPNATDLNVEELRALIKSQRTRLKTFLLDQSKIAGIGNAYIHDILFLAGLHPLRPLASLTDEEIARMQHAIHTGLQLSIEKGGAFYEVNLHGQKGGFQVEDIIIGYKEDQPCPVCGAPIQKIKTGSTSSFICPVCQTP